MLGRHAQLTEEVARFETLVEEHRRELEMQNSSRLGAMYDVDDGVSVTQEALDEEERQVRILEEKIKKLQERVLSQLS